MKAGEEYRLSAIGRYLFQLHVAKDKKSWRAVSATPAAQS
jgi:hypothetical protein